MHQNEGTPNSGRLSELLKQVDEETVWQTVVWNEAFESNIITNEVFEANIIVDTAEAENRQSFTVLKSEDERARIEVRTVDRENREEWTYLQNTFYNSTHGSDINVPGTSRTFEQTCTANKSFIEEARERSNEGMHKRMKHQANDLTVRRQGMSTNSLLELRFNSLKEDYTCFLRSQRSKSECVDCPRSPRFSGESDCQKESNNQNSHDYTQNIDLTTVKPGIEKPLRAPTTTNVGTRRCRSAGEEDESNKQVLLSRIGKEYQSVKDSLEFPTNRDVSTRRCRSAEEGEGNQHALEFRIDKQKESLEGPPVVPATTGNSVSCQSGGEEKSNHGALVLRIGNENQSREEGPPVPTTPGASARGCRAAGDWESNHLNLVLEIENENQSLKELLADFMRRNELHATSIRHINQQLEELENKLEKRRRSDVGTDRAHHSRISSKTRTPKEPQNTTSTALCR